VQNRELDITTIKSVFKFNSSYASALLASIDGVAAMTRPIQLVARGVPA
jgi:hypothetical protein